MKTAANARVDTQRKRRQEASRDAGEQECLDRCAGEIRRSLRCACGIAVRIGSEGRPAFSVDAGGAGGSARRERISAFLLEQLNRDDRVLDPASFRELPDLADLEGLRCASPSPLGVSLILLAFGVKKEKRAAQAWLKACEEETRLRIENLQLSSALTQHHALLGELHKSISGLNRHLLNLGELMETISQEAQRLMNAGSAAIYMPADERRSSFSLKAWAGARYPLMTPELNQRLANVLLEYEMTRRKIHVDVDETGNQILLVPLVQRTSPGGILAFCSSDPSFHFTEELLQMAELFGDWASILIENAVMFEKVSGSQREWENTFDSISDPIYLIDTDYRLKKINKSLASYSMLSIKLPAMQNCYRYLFHRDSICPWCPVPRSMQSGQAVSVEATLFNGGIWQIQSFPFTDKSETRGGSINVMRDLTLLKRMQDQLIEVEKMASIGKLISGVAHEVRNPLFGISTTVRALGNELGNKEEFKPFLDIVTSETARLNRLMEELLNYSRPVKIDKNPSDIGEIIREVIGSYANVPAGREVNLRLFGAETVHPINVDRNKIHQVLLNLVENGIQHSTGVPRIDIFLEYLSLSNPPEIHIVVKDYGNGIPPEVLPRIFDPFFTTRSKGTGLGLSIVRKVVHDHGGRISVESHRGKGTTFRIVLPVHSVER